MNKTVYNVSMLIGVLFSSIGAGLIYIPAGLILCGIMLIGLTIFGSNISKSRED